MTQSGVGGLRLDSPVRPGRQRQLVTVALMMAMATVAVEGTIVITALPTVVGELHGIALYPWVFSVYLLTSTTSVPIYGKLADVFGRKPVFLFGLGLLLVGTLLCGASGSMVQLIAFRAIQGLGAGAILPLIFTVTADIYTVEERARLQAVFSAVWGTMSLVGPGFGAFVIANVSWRWVFLSGVPVILVTALLLWLFLQERVERRQVVIDYGGAVTLTLGLAALLLAVLEGGRDLPWGSWQIVSLLALAALLLAAFVAIERRAVDPMIPFRAFRNRVVAVSSVGNLLMGICMFGLMSYVPLFAQGVRGESAAGASAVLTPLLLGWAGSAMLSGRLFVKVGFRWTALLGTSLITLGCGILAFVGESAPLLLVGVAMGFAGLGFGISSPAFILAPQTAVPWNLRGVITSSTQFFRTIGGAVGVALLGAALNWRLLAELPRGLAEQDVEGLLNKIVNVEGRASLSAETVQSLSTAMAHGLHLVYLELLVVAAIGLLQIVLFAESRGNRETEVSETAMEPASQQA